MSSFSSTLSSYSPSSRLRGGDIFFVLWYLFQYHCFSFVINLAKSRNEWGRGRAVRCCLARSRLTGGGGDRGGCLRGHTRRRDTRAALSVGNPGSTFFIHSSTTAFSTTWD